MKLSISLGKLNGKYALAHIENDDENIIDVTDGHHKDPKAACVAAAKALREAATRFDALADEAEPFNYKTPSRPMPPYPRLIPHPLLFVDKLHINFT